MRSRMHDSQDQLLRFEDHVPVAVNSKQNSGDPVQEQRCELAITTRLLESLDLRGSTFGAGEAAPALQTSTKQPTIRALAFYGLRPAFFAASRTAPDLHREIQPGHSEENATSDVRRIVNAQVNPGDRH